MAKFPDKFNVASQQSKERNFFPLRHNHITTTDFFKMQPVVARKVEPNDSMDIDVTSFVRLFPMPFPVLGRIRYYNRCFFVPYRQIMEGFNEFITDVQYRSSNGFVKIQSAPYFTNKDICDAFYSSYVDQPTTIPLCEPVTNQYYWRTYNDVDYIVNNLGKMIYFTLSGSPSATIIRTKDGLRFSRNGDSFFNLGASAFGDDVVGTYASPVNNNDGTYTVTFTDTNLTETYKFTYNFGLSPIYYGEFDPSYTIDDEMSSTPFDQVRYDFKFGSTPMRFTNKGRHFYTVLCSLGYRVDFSNDGNNFTNTRKRSAAKLLAYVKIFLDWYHPSAYSENCALRMLFVGVASSGRHITYNELVDISAGLDYVTYERDYFTSAWQTPDGPNVGTSNVVINDFVINNGSTNQNYRSAVRNSSMGGSNHIGDELGTPTIFGEAVTNGTVSNRQAVPYNLSMYILDSLRALTNDSRRAQLSGNKVVDRYLAQYGIKLDDDRSNRCYYIGGYSYDADIMDIMSTADTSQAALGDYAGKGIAYSDAHRSFHFESGQEHGIILVVSSVVPEVGYVQGVDRENLQLTRFEFFNGDFDNLGSQPQLREELFADVGMPAPDGSEFTSVVAPDGVRGFVPRYIEEKIGRDFLTGDFNVPSRREGMDAFHLFRLFNTSNIPTINQGFLIGEQKQYDRIFNNIDDDYDHMYVTHHVYIKAWRNMKSIQDVYDFEHSDGKSIDVDANGTQLN